MFIVGFIGFKNFKKKGNTKGGLIYSLIALIVCFSVCLIAALILRLIMPKIIDFKLIYVILISCVYAYIVYLCAAMLLIAIEKALIKDCDS